MMQPILFRLPEWLGGIPIPAYGVLSVIGLALGAVVFAWLAGRSGADRGRAFEVALEIMLVSFASSKVVGLLFQPPTDIPFWEQVVRTGGVWYVGFLTGVLWAAIRLPSLGLRTLHALDIAATAVPYGHAVGRLACFFAGCCWGSTCDLPWAITFGEEAHALTGVPAGVPLHPTQLYEAAAELANAAILTAMVVTRRYRFHLQPGLTYLVLYAVVRLVIERFRDDPRGLAAGLATSEWIAIAILAIAVPLYVVGLVRGTLDPRKPRIRGGEVAAP